MAREMAMTGRHWGCGLALLASAAVYALFAKSFFPNPAGRVGEDYSYFLPLILAGRYWITANGLFALPDFSPAFCGGLPFLANPQSIFYSAPQALAEFVDPLTSVFLTLVLFAWLGGLGTFVLLRRRFDTSLAAAALGAVIFLFNGFLLYRMAIGQVTYHAVGLLPLLCFVLLTPLDGRPDWLRRFLVMTALGGAILTYVVYCGAPNIIVPLALAALAVWLLHALACRPVMSFWPLGLGAGLLAAAAGAAKLAPALVFVSEFRRDGTLFIFPDLATALPALFQAFFLPSALPQFAERHEFEFGLGLVPLVLLVGGAGAALARGALRRRPPPQRWLAAIGLAAVLAIPLWLNCGGPQFAAWLRTLPYIGENGMLVRWFFVYLLPLAIAAALMLDLLFADPRVRGGVALIGILATVGQALVADTTHYRQQPYDPSPILAADRALRRTGLPPPVTAIAAGRAFPDNDLLAAGASAFPCYEPLFGYKLQTFPWGLRLGPLSLPDRHLRNPACYIYGRDNSCSPGDGFAADAAAAETAFAAYRPFAYRRPEWQLAADIASLVGLGAILAGICLGIYALCRHLSVSGRKRPAPRAISR
ncbi:MAG TPA: hypothetical protein VKQ73_04160 [Stellaceae bacterium]|nr:hypothetical protein [Stellaceae bacterium]